MYYADKTTLQENESVTAGTGIPDRSTNLKDIFSIPPPTANSCPLPSLVFNNSQGFTKLGNDVGITQLVITGQYGSYNFSSSMPNRIPLRGVIYHDSGITRIFDSFGRQVLLVNDAESIAYTPGGAFPATFVYGLPEYSHPVDEGDNITNIYTQGNFTCIATIIKAPSSRVNVIHENRPQFSLKLE